MKLFNSQKGYVLPSVLVFSLVMISLGVTFMQYTTSFSNVLRKDYYGDLAKKASETGVKAAAKCFQEEIKTIDNWPDGALLTPEKNCTFTTITGAKKHISEDKNGVSSLRTTYSVGKPTATDQLLTFTGTGKTELFGSNTSSSPALSHTEISKLQVPATDAYSTIDAARGLAVTDIATGSEHTCAIVNLSPYCWGANKAQQLGKSGASFSYINTIPGKVNDPSYTHTSFANEFADQITAGPGLTCVTTLKGWVTCWGINSPFGSLGLGENLSPAATTPRVINTGYFAGQYPKTPKAAISSSHFFNVDTQNYTCMLSHGKISCAGQNFFAQLGLVRYGTRPGHFEGFKWIPAELGIQPTAEFTMWAFPTGFVDYAKGSNSPIYKPIFGYDKSASSSTRLNEQSQVGKFNATELSTAQINVCANENGEITCWGEQAMPWVMSQNSWCALGTNLIDIGDLTPICTNGLALYNGNVIDPDGKKNRSVDSLQGKMAYGLAATHSATCAIAEGQAHCWGREVYQRSVYDSLVAMIGLVPVHKYSSNAQPRSVTEGRDVTSISQSGGSSYACYVASGKTYCWGKMKAMPTLTWPAKLEITPDFVEKVEGGGEQTCAVANGSAYCFGGNNVSQLGDNTTTHRSTPVKPIGIGLEENTYSMTSIDGGGNSSCGIVNGNVFCWGDNTYGQLGTGDTSAKLRPTQVVDENITDEQSATDVSTGKSHSCAVIEGDVYCWGRNNYGQLGNGNTVDSDIPVKVTFPGTGHKSATKVTANGNHTCAVVNGRAWCWGYNGQAQLGNGNYTNQSTPVQINIGSPQRHITSISAGENFTCAIGAERVWCWGSNDRGQIGRGDIGGVQTTAREVVIGSSSYNGLGFASTKIAAGDKFACTIMNGKTQCWGDNSHGQLGRNSATAAFGNPSELLGSPIQAGKSIDLTTGANHACSITNGDVYCWGNNSDGQFGNATTTSSRTPVMAHHELAVLGENKPYRLASGDAHSCAIANGKVACWGSGSNGQLGGNDVVSSNIPKLTHNKYAIGGLTYDWTRVRIY